MKKLVKALENSVQVMHHWNTHTIGTITTIIYVPYMLHRDLAKAGKRGGGGGGSPSFLRQNLFDVVIKPTYML